MREGWKELKEDIQGVLREGQGGGKRRGWWDEECREHKREVRRELRRWRKQEIGGKVQVQVNKKEVGGKVKVQVNRGC